LISVRLSLSINNPDECSFYEIEAATRRWIPAGLNSSYFPCQAETLGPQFYPAIH
jgi:hypothetical protein